MKHFAFLLSLLGVLIGLYAQGQQAAIPAANESRGITTMHHTEKATLAAGCFWGVQEKLDHVKGVIKTTVGYTGGTLKNPTYEQVCTHATGHAEAVEVEFDPSIVSYDELLNAFWNLHDPTQVNRQGPDIGDNYRSAIFYHGPEQRAAAEASKQALAARLGKKIATEVVPATEFYPAEDYHQHYAQKHGMMCR
ncbi:MAG: peptide-methionine (S)-S-oxide reductase MsrA [Verrucomicrobiota bacterium]